jgi:quinol-cytochrome oxidoreductase complex cytochrome b subunit
MTWFSILSLVMVAFALIVLLLVKYQERHQKKWAHDRSWFTVFGSRCMVRVVRHLRTVNH